MIDLIIIDDQKVSSSLRDILDLHPNQYKIVKEIRNPATEDRDIKNGELGAYIDQHFTSFKKKNPIFLVDLWFPGDDHRQDRLGVEICRFLLNYEEGWKPLIVVCTNNEGQLLFNKLYAIGVRRFLLKTELEFSLMAALYAARKDNPFLGSFIPNLEALSDNIDIETQVIKMVAKGFSNTAIMKHNFPSVGPQKASYKRKNMEELLKLNVPFHRVPKSDEWNDVAFLLHLLRERDKDVIDYVKKVCNLDITIPLDR